MKAKITEDMMNAINKKQIDALQAWWDANSTEEMREQAKGKTMKGALAFIRSVAKKLAVNNMAMISDEDTYGLLVHYMADEEEGATVGDEKTPAPKVKTEAERLAEMSEEEKAVYLQEKAKREAEQAEKEAARKAREVERIAREAAKKAKAEALKRAAEAQMTFF